MKSHFEQVYILGGILIGLTALSMLIVVFFVRVIQDEKDKTRPKIGMCANNLKIVVEFIRHLKNRNQLLLIPINIWLGCNLGFLGAEFTRVPILNAST